MQQTSAKGVQDLVWLDEKGDPLRIVQEIELDHTTKWYEWSLWHNG